MKILAFAASNSSQSINKQLVEYSKQLIESGLIEGAQVEVLDINDYEMPLYSSDREEAGGIPQLAHDFKAKIEQADALVVSFAEHNGSYTAAFKNLFDWTSRIDMAVYQNTPTVMLATSPGKGGAANVLNTAKTSAPYFGGNVVADLSVAEFYNVFDSEAGELTDEGYNQQLKQALQALVS